jgi:hypothetical protein
MQDGRLSGNAHEPGALTEFEQWRMDILRRVYAVGIQVFLDPHSQVIDILFVACPMNTMAEAQLAFTVLYEQVRRVLVQAGLNRAPLLVDIAGLSIGTNITSEWSGMLKQFLQAVCTEVRPGTGQFLNARYNSTTDANLTAQQRGLNIEERVRNIYIMTEAVARNMQSNIVGSRQEALALITILRGDSSF